MIAWIIIILAAIAVDQATKALAVRYLEYGEPVVIIKNVLQLNYDENPGMAFGLLGEKPYERWIFMIVSTLGIIALIVYLFFFKPKEKMACVGFSLVIGGGIGNMIDRLFRMGTLEDTTGRYVVVDFIDFCALPREIWRYVFNIADSCVCVGAGILMCWCLYSLFNDMKAEKRKIAAEKRQKVGAANAEVEEVSEEVSKDADEPCQKAEDAEAGEAEGEKDAEAFEDNIESEK